MSLPTEAGWRRFVGRYHATHAGITEDLLGSARDHAGRTPYEWIAAAVPAEGLLLDLACGSAPLVDLVGADRYVGIDRSLPELTLARRRRPAARLAAADALAPPVRGRFAAVAISMALMLLDLDVLLARLAPLQPPGGVLVAIVPARDTAAVGLPYRELLDVLELTGRPFPEPLEPGGVAGRFRRGGYALASDEIGSFARPLRDEADVTLVLDSFYTPPRVRPGPARDYLDALRERDGVLRYPLRRLIAHRL